MTYKSCSCCEMKSSNYVDYKKLTFCLACLHILRTKLSHLKNTMGGI